MTQTAFEIRPAGPADVPAIRTCAEEAYAQYVEAIGRKPAPMVADFETQTAAGHVYVATSEDQGVMGFIVFFQLDDHVLLENVATRSNATGQGIGRALIRFCEDQAREMGVATIRLYTNVNMTQNLSLYPHLDYKETGRVIEDGFHRVYFQKPL